MIGLKRLALVVGATLLPLLIAELLLQISSGFYRTTLLRSREATIDETAVRILCVGDSNTFGTRVDEKLAYPGQLERMLNECATDGARYQVLNRGIPGQNTTQIGNRLIDQLAEVEPKFVFALGGLNNTWNEAGTHDEVSWYERSRLLKLMRIAWNDLTSTKRSEKKNEIAEIERLDEPSAVTTDELRQRTRRDLVTIVERARAAGATPVLMTYAGQHPHSIPMNEAARLAAQETGALLVDNDVRFREYVARYGYSALMFEDSHPAEAGYQLVARDALSDLIGALLVKAKLPADRYEPTQFKIDPVLEVVHDPEGKPVALRLSAEANLEFQIYLSPVLEPQYDLGTRKLPIGAHPWLKFCEEYQPFRGQLDASGRARVDLPDKVRKLERGSVLHATFVTLDPRKLHEFPVRSIAPAVTIGPK